MSNLLSTTTATLNESEPCLTSKPEILNNEDEIIFIKTKKKVSFNSVHLFYFDRTQGYECIPSDDSKKSITLGMSYKHSYLVEFDQIDDYLKFKRKTHLEKLDEEKEKIFFDLNLDYSSSDLLDYDEADLDDEARKIIEITSNREQYENINIDLPINMDLFCPILGPIERRLKLAECSFINEIDENETKDIKFIKKSRETCGCKCTQLGVQCGTSELCTCFSNGIGCQLDKNKFPCDCTVKKCKNPFGLKKFDQKSVLNHYKEVFSENYSPFAAATTAATYTSNGTIVNNLDSDLENDMKSVNRRKRKRSAQFCAPKKRKI